MAKTTQYVLLVTDVQTTRFDHRVEGPFATEDEAKRFRTTCPTAKNRVFKVLPLIAPPDDWQSAGDAA